MMGLLENLVHIIVLNVLFLSSILLSLIFFGLLPSAITVQQLMVEEKFYQRYGSILKLTRQYSSYFKFNLKKYWGLSVLYSLVFFLFFVNTFMVQTIAVLAPLKHITLLYGLIMVIHFLFLIPILNISIGSTKEKIKLAIIAPIINIKATFINIIILVLVSILFIYYPSGLILIYPVGLLELTRRINTKHIQQKRLIK